MNIYLLNIPFALVGAVIVVVPLVRQMKHPRRTNGESCGSSNSSETHATDFDYVA